MGLAASQARLLTITARLADNELRSQTINNAKMRLATQSAQASDEYVQALNSAQMMFSNTTVDGLSQSQPLTFNALTQYSPYNNQYGLVNSAGQILVSEEDAKIFEGCNNDLEAFLRAHNLEWSTTFFDETSGNLSEKLTSFFDGESGPEIAYLYAGKTNEELKQMYLDSLSQDASLEYLNYDILSRAYMNAAVNLYNSCIDDIMATVLGPYGGNIEAAAEQIASGNSFAQVKSILNTLHSSMAQFVSDEVYQSWERNIKLDEYYIGGTSYIAITSKEINLTSSFQPVDQGANINVRGDGLGNMEISIPSDIAAFKNGQQFYPGIFGGIVTDSVNNAGSYAFAYEGDFIKFDHPAGYGDNRVDLLYLEPSSEINLEEFVKSYLSAMFSESAFDANKVRTTYGQGLPALQVLINAEENFSKYGLNLTMPAEAKYLVDFGKLVADKPDTINNAINSSPEFKSVLNSFAVDMMLDVLGEPKYAWTDRTDNANTGNADSKAQWLTNLFNRMQNGYKVLENGLAKSSEWLEYAFESGLVTMEQVDMSQNWKSLDYKACSNIFEQTDNSTAVAKAEAKYNRAMNDIKQKDSMFDLQLKNIDTEHNALQTEYDVIKGVISKNIERTMKFNQSA